MEMVESTGEARNPLFTAAVVSNEEEVRVGAGIMEAMTMRYRARSLRASSQLER